MSDARLYDEHPSPSSVPVGVERASDVDAPLTPPASLPAATEKCTQERFERTPIYASLETNIDADVMAFTEEPIPAVSSEASRARFGPHSPFRHHTVIQQYVEGLCTRKDYGRHIEYNVTVERAAKSGDEWVLTLRRAEATRDVWWQERFDALVVCSGHFHVPVVPELPGLAAFAAQYPGAVEHTKNFRHRDDYRGLNVVVIGGNISAMDMAFDLVDCARHVAVSVRGAPHPYFTDAVFSHPRIHRHPGIRRVSPDDRTLHYVDGTVQRDVDKIVLGTGYRFSLPFLPEVDVSNNRLHGVYQHVFNINDPSLAYVGAVSSGLTFKTFEWQAVLVSRFFAGRCRLPPVAAQREWEAQRVAARGDSAKFAVQYPDFEEYFDAVRDLAGNQGPGRKLPPFDRRWSEKFDACVRMRIDAWVRDIEAARRAQHTAQETSAVHL